MWVIAGYELVHKLHRCEILLALTSDLVLLLLKVNVGTMQTTMSRVAFGSIAGLRPAAPVRPRASRMVVRAMADKPAPGSLQVRSSMWE